MSQDTVNAPEQRDFKGVWIPKAVWLDTRLNALDKVILTEIDSLDQGERGCYASNKHIADFCQCSERKVSESIAQLIKCGYLRVQKFDGRQRELRSRLAEIARQTSKNHEADTQILRESNTVNNTTNNTVNKKIDKPPKHKYGEYNNVLLTDAELDKLKADYPDWQTRIDRLSGYIAQSGKKYSSHYATIRNWAKKDAEQPRRQNNRAGGNVFLEILEEGG